MTVVGTDFVCEWTTSVSVSVTAAVAVTWTAGVSSALVTSTALVVVVWTTSVMFECTVVMVSVTVVGVAAVGSVGSSCRDMFVGFLTAAVVVAAPGVAVVAWGQCSTLVIALFDVRGDGIDFFVSRRLTRNSGFDLVDGEE